MAKDVRVLQEGLNQLNSSTLRQLVGMKEQIQWLNAKTFDQDELIRHKLTSLEKMENELVHLHDDVEKVKEVQTTSENNKEDISEIKT